MPPGTDRQQVAVPPLLPTRVDLFGSKIPPRPLDVYAALNDRFGSSAFFAD